MQAFDLDKLVANHSPKSVRLKAYLPMILAALDARVPMSAILEEVNRCTGLDLGINYFSNLVYSWRKEVRSQGSQEAAGFPTKTPPAPQTNQVVQVHKAPIQASQAVQSSGSPVKEVKAPVSVTEPAKEVKTTLESRKAEEVRPAGVKSSREEVENMLREQNEERGALEISMAHLRASFGGPALTLARATSYMGRPVTEEELPSLIARGNQLRAAGRSEIFG